MAGPNPFNPGYFPGERQLKNYGRGMVPQYESDFSIYEELDADIDAAFEKLDQAYKIPASPAIFLYNNMVNDAKRSLRLNAIPNKYNASQIQAAGEEGELAGTSGLKLDLYAVAKDPKKGMSKFVKGAATEFFNYSDFDLRAERDLFKNIMQGTADSKMGFGYAEAKGMVQKRVGQDLSLAGESAVIESTSKLYDYAGYVAGSGADPTRVAETVDLYEEFTNNFADFVNTKRVGSARDGSYLKVAHTGAKIQKKHLEDILEAHGVDQIINGQTVKVLSSDVIGKSGVITTAEELAQATVVAKTAIAEADLAASLGYFSKALGDSNKALSAALRQGDAAGIEKQLKFFEANVEKMRNFIEGDATKGIASIGEQIDSIKGVYGTDSILGATELVGQFEKATEPYLKFAENFQKSVLDELTNTDYKALMDKALLGDKLALKTLQKKMDIFKDQFGGGSLAADLLPKGSLFGDGVERSFMKYLMEERLQKVGTPGLMNATDVMNAFGITGGAKIAAWMETAQFQRLRETAWDIHRQLKQGILFNNILWFKVKLRINITPEYIIKEYLIKRTHGFGLLYDSDYKDAAYTPFKALMAMGIFKNKIRAEVVIGGVTMNLTFFGGEALKPVEFLNQLINENNLTAEGLGKLLGVARDGNIEEFTELLGKMGIKTKIDAQAFMDQLKKFDEWWFNQCKRLGLDHTSMESLYNVIIKLASKAKLDLVKITEEAAGLLQKASVVLNRLQSSVAAKLVRFVAPIQYLKKIIAEALTDLIIAGTEGIATPLKLAIQWLIVKILDVAEAIGKAVIKLDFRGLADMAEETFTKVTKWYAAATLVPFAGIALVMFLFVSLLTTISPADPTKTGGGCADQGGCTLDAGTSPSTGPLTGDCPNLCFFKDIDPFTVTSYTGEDLPWETAGNPIYGAFNPYGHGSNDYYDTVPLTRCGSVLPSLGVRPYAPTSSADPEGDNYCLVGGDTPAADYFGYCWDVFPLDADGDGLPEDTTLCMPSLGSVVEWNIGSVYSLSLGEMIIAEGFDASGVSQYTMKIQHTSGASTGTYAPGEEVSGLYNWGSNTHIHIELEDAAGNIVRPENAGFCN